MPGVRQGDETFNELKEAIKIKGAKKVMIKNYPFYKLSFKGRSAHVEESLYNDLMTEIEKENQ